MSIFKKISTKFIGITPEDETEENEEQKGAPVAEIGARASRPRETGANLSAFPEFSVPAGAAGGTPIDNVVAAYRMNVVVIEPQTFDDAQQVAVNLQKKKPVVLNFEKTEKSVANRIIEITPIGIVDRISTYDEYLSNETVKQQLAEKYKAAE